MPDEVGPWIPNSNYDIIAVGTQECRYAIPGHSNMYAKLRANSLKPKTHEILKL